MLNYQYSHVHEATSMEMERYRGTLIEGIMSDEPLRTSLADFSGRLRMYNQLALIFEQNAALGQKNCNIEVNHVLYKKTGDDFANVPPQETDTYFSFVLSQYQFAKDLDKRCEEGIIATWDQDDANNSIPSSDKCKRKIEIYGLALLILKIETILLMVNTDGSYATSAQNIADSLAMMPDAPPDIAKYYKTKKVTAANTSMDILATVMMWGANNGIDMKALGSNELVLKGKPLLPNFAYVELANLTIFQQRVMMQYEELQSNEDVRNDVFNNYTAFNNLLQTMLQPNDFMNGRPDATAVRSALNKIYEDYAASISTFDFDRILLI